MQLLCSEQNFAARATDRHTVACMSTVLPLHPDRTLRREPLWRELVGAQLRRRRQDRGERLTDVAQRAGVSPQYLSEVERGRKEPSSEMLAAMLGALDLTLVDLTGQVHAALAPVLHTRGSASLQLVA